MSAIGSREQTLVYFRSDYARIELSDFIRDRCGRLPDADCSGSQCLFRVAVSTGGCNTL